MFPEFPEFQASIDNRGTPDYYSPMDTINNDGFTLIEVIAVLILIGIISAVVVGRMSDTNVAALDGYTAELKASLRYAQINSMMTESFCSIDFSADSYEYKDGKNPSQLLPGKNQKTIATPSGFTVTHPGSIVFDTWGRSGQNRTDDDNNGLLDSSENSVITISLSGESKIINIIGETGYIEIQ